MRLSLAPCGYDSIRNITFRSALDRASLQMRPMYGPYTQQVQPKTTNSYTGFRLKNARLTTATAAKSSTHVSGGRFHAIQTTYAEIHFRRAQTGRENTRSPYGRASRAQTTTATSETLARFPRMKYARLNTATAARSSTHVSGGRLHATNGPPGAAQSKRPICPISRPPTGPPHIHMAYQLTA